MGLCSTSPVLAKAGGVSSLALLSEGGTGQRKEATLTLLPMHAEKDPAWDTRCPTPSVFHKTGAGESLLG